MLRIAYLGLHVTAALAAAAFLIEGADRYSSLLVQLFLFVLFALAMIGFTFEGVGLLLL